MDSLEGKLAGDGFSSWKEQLGSDACLRRLLDKNCSSRELLEDIVSSSNEEEIARLRATITAARLAISARIDKVVEDNHEQILEEFQREKGFRMDVEECRLAMNHLRPLVSSIEVEFCRKYELVQSQLPLLQNTYRAIEVAKSCQLFHQSWKALKALNVEQPLES